MKSQERGPTAPGPGAAPPGTVALVVIAVVLVGAAVTHLGPILKPLLVGLLIYYVTRAAAAALVRFRVPHRLAYACLFLAACAVLLGLAVLVTTSASSFLEAWPRYEEKLLALLQRLGMGEEVHSLWQLFDVSTQDLIRLVFEPGVGLLELALMACFYVLFILLSAAKLPGRVERAFPGERARQLREIGTKVSDGMEKFVQVKTAVSAGLALSTAVVLYLFGLRHWLLWSFLFFALNYITYIGSIAACVPPVVLAFLQFESPWAATALAVLVVLNRFFWIDYVEIRLSGKRLNLDSVLLFVWLAYWGWAWGVVGLVLAFPMLHSLKIVLENVDATRRWAVLMGED